MKPILLNDIPPGLPLREYVRKYQVFRFVFDQGVIPPVKFHAPRPEHSLTFYVRDGQKFSNLHADTVTAYPRCVINGIYTLPIHRHGSQDFLAIKVVFQPTALSRLRALPVGEITNRFVNAEEVLGREVAWMGERLSRLDKLEEMLKMLDRFLIQWISKKGTACQPFDRASNYLVKQADAVGLDWLADQSCLSVRQFIRKFEAQIGVSPKLFQKIIRFDQAFRLKNNCPHLDWLSIALACGYCDYQHLAKDFKEFTDLTPPAFYEVEKASPERRFALQEG